VARKGEKSDCKRGEDRLRCLLGLQVANDFINQLLSSIPEPDRLKRSCGTTEWVICTPRTAEGVRQAFTSNNFDENTEGDDKCWGESRIHWSKTSRNICLKFENPAVFEHKKGKFQEEHYVSL